MPFIIVAHELLLNRHMQNQSSQFALIGFTETGAIDTVVAKSAMHACDQSMKLLLGSTMSLGTLRGMFLTTN